MYLKKIGFWFEITQDSKQKSSSRKEKTGVGSNVGNGEASPLHREYSDLWALRSCLTSHRDRAKCKTQLKVIPC
jgi:hypothetical protein